MSKDLTLNLKENNVPISIGKDLVFSLDFLSFCKTLGNRFVIITDQNVEKLLGEKLNLFFQNQHMDSFIISIPAGDSFKTRETKALIEDQMLQKKINKSGLIIALGGGMVLDMAAFVASTYYRGIPLVMVPTSLLAMVDASIGGKTAVNTKEGKNLIGSYYHPKKIFIDIQFLKTLPKEEYRNGFSEIIKYGIIYDKDLFNSLYEKTQDHDFEEIIYKCCLIKKTIVERDEKENNIRAILNFGHTLGHSLENLENYKISHGEAIGLGMIFASFLSVKMKILNIEDFFKIFSMFKKYHFPLVFSQNISAKDIFDQLLSDKKASLARNFVLIEKIGSIKDDIYLQEVDEKILKKALFWLCNRFSSKAALWK